VVVVMVEQHLLFFVELMELQTLAVVVVQVKRVLAQVALESSSSDTLQHKAHQHHLVAQTTHKFHTLMATKYTLGQLLEL
jgi:hypothetical protein